MIKRKGDWNWILGNAESYLVIAEKKGVLSVHTKGRYEERIVARLFKKPVEEVQADKVLPKRIQKRTKTFPVLMKGKEQATSVNHQPKGGQS